MPIKCPVIEKGGNIIHIGHIGRLGYRTFLRVAHADARRSIGEPGTVAHPERLEICLGRAFAQRGEMRMNTAERYVTRPNWIRRYTNETQTNRPQKRGDD